MMSSVRLWIVAAVVGCLIGGPTQIQATLSAEPPAGAARSAPEGTAGAASTLPLLPFDHILPYLELTELLRSWAAARPDILELESLGETPEGRQLWFLTLTRRSTGPASDKPALVVDGNMHANEWGGGVAALHFVWKLLREDGRDEQVTRLLDTRAVYVLPRMSPDGVEASLTEGRYIRSVNRPYPEKRARPGLHAGDLDGDGRSLFIRFRDANGPWKEHSEDPRLLVPRRPDEMGGDYWRMIPEGSLVDFDGVTIREAPSLEDIDLGRNFPGDQGTASASVQAGPYPGSEIEVGAYVAAIAERPNIVIHVTCHNFGGLVLTPPVNVGERLSPADRRAISVMADKAAELTGYDAMSYLDLRTGDDRETQIPSAFGWLYDRRGIFSFITEFWNPLRAAGISLEGTTASAWLWGYHPVEDEIQLLRWSDEELGGAGFVSWYRFDHPQLGPVEIGGWDLIRYWYNAPFDRLEKEVAPHSDWLVYLGLVTPRIEVRSLVAEPLSENLWRVRLVVDNTGWLPTSGSRRAVDQEIVRGVVADLALPAGGRLLRGGTRVELGELAGRSEERSTATWWSYTPGTPNRAFAEWFVGAPAGSRVTVAVAHDRAGTDRAEVVLGGSSSDPQPAN